MKDQHPLRLSRIRVYPLKGAEIRFALEAPGMGPFDLRPGSSDVWLEARVHEDRFLALAGLEGTGRFRVGDDVHILERGGRRPPLPFSGLGRGTDPVPRGEEYAWWSSA